MFDSPVGALRAPIRPVASFVPRLLADNHVASNLCDYGGVAALPLLSGTTFLPLWWLTRLIGGLKQGIITSRIRTGSRTAQLISYSRAGPPDGYPRKAAPGRVWMAWLIEVALFVFIAPFFLVIVVGVMLEGGPE